MCQILGRSGFGLQGQIIGAERDTHQALVVVGQLGVLDVVGHVRPEIQGAAVLARKVLPQLLAAADEPRVGAGALKATSAAANGSKRFEPVGRVMPLIEQRGMRQAMACVASAICYGHIVPLWHTTSGHTSVCGHHHNRIYGIG